MAKWNTFHEKLMGGQSDANIDFEELCHYLQHLGFTMKRKRGSHHILHRADIAERIVIQPRKDGKAKPYQVEQVREILQNHPL